mgnify:CR=1 FL=1
MPLDEELFRFRQDSLVNPLKYITVDVESESVNLAYSRPWQLSFIVIENNQIKLEVNKYIKIHDLNISEGAKKVTRFNNKEYQEGAEDPKIVYDLLASYLYNPDYYVVGQNFIFFDLYQIKNLQKYLGEKEDFSYLNRVYDTLPLGRAYQLNIKFPTKKEEILPWQYRFSSYRQKGLKASLEALSKLFDINYDHNMAHSALYDVKLTKEVFKNLYFKLEVF